MSKFIFKTRFLCVLFLSFLSTTSFADAGYVRHRIVNNTPSELYVGIRQLFQYPSESCFGPVASGETKECNDGLKESSPSFIVELIKSTSQVKEELRGKASVANPYAKNLFITWIITLDDEERLSVSLKTDNDKFKWQSTVSLSQ